MNVSSYLEAFLTVYGWEMYYILYLLLGATGLFMYPLLRLYATTIIEYFSGSEYAGTNFLRSALTNTLLAILVFIVALVPFVPIELEKTHVNSVCGNTPTIDKTKGDAYFDNAYASVPIMPWIAMRIGHGINGVIYAKAPCVLDITATRKAMLNVNLSGNDRLKHEYVRFKGECQRQVINTIDRIRNGHYGDEAQQWIEAEIVAAVLSADNKKNSLTDLEMVMYIDSDLVNKLFYQSPSPMSSVKGLENLAETINAANPVDGFKGYTKGSAMQGVAGVPPSCGEWWRGDGSGNGLRQRIAATLHKSVTTTVGASVNIPECETDRFSRSSDGANPNTAHGGGSYHSAAKQEECHQKIVADIADGDEQDYTKQLLLYNQGKGQMDSVLSGSDNMKLAGAVTAGIGGMVLASITGVDLVGGVTGQLVGFYTSLYLLKLLLRYFIPMILMAIYMFWGVYMTVGEFRGTTMIKGMILIIALTMMPSLWAIIDHLDDKLWEAMYGTSGFGDLFNMLLLDVATSIFEVSVVMVLFFLINAAGGGDAGGAVGSSQGMGKDGDSSVGGSAGQGTNKFGSWANTGKRDKSGNIVSGGWGSRATGYLKGAFGKSKGK